MKTDHLKAINPDTRKLVNVLEFIKDVGINYKEKGKEPICPSCNKQMKVYGYTSPALTTRFMHISDSTNCLLSTSSKRHNIFTEADYDHSKGILLRNSFCNEDIVTETYAVAHALCNRRLTVTEYHLMIMIADRRDLWSLSGLTLEVLPYLFVLLIDFKKDSSAYKGNTKRSYTYRFILHKPKKETINTLWKHSQDCFLTRVFVGGHFHGKTIQNPATNNVIKWKISDEKYESARLKHQWISANFINKLMKYCH